MTEDGPNQDIKELILSGRTKEAIQLYRARYNVGQDRAQEAIEAWAETLRISGAKDSGEEPEPSPAARPHRRWYLLWLA